MEIYKIISDIMRNQNLSVADIAKKSNLPDSTVRGIVTRKQKNIALEVAFKLSQGLGVSSFFEKRLDKSRNAFYYIGVSRIE